MPPLPHKPGVLRGRVFLARRALEAGLLTRDDLRTRAWQRLFQGVYADSALPVTHQLRCAAAAAYLVPAGGALAGRSAAAMYGTGLAEPADPVEVLVPPGSAIGRYQGLLIHQGALESDDVRLVGGISTTTPVRTGWDLARWLDPIEAVVLIDRLLGAHLVSQEQLDDCHEEHRGERGSRRFAHLLSLVDGGAASPPETRLRVRLVLAGLPRPEVQFTVRGTNGSFVARVDLAWPELQIAVEYDGLWHVGSAKQMHHDRKRLNALVSAGWLVLHVTAARLADDFDGVVAEVQAAMRHRTSM